MSTHTGIDFTCQYCGRPCVGSFLWGHSGPYHLECTRGPGYVAPILPEPAAPTETPFSCFHCRDAHTPLYCLNCAEKALASINRGKPEAVSAEPTAEATLKALQRARDMLSAICGDLEDGYSIDALRAKYFEAVLNARDDATTVIRAAMRAQLDAAGMKDAG